MTLLRILLFFFLPFTIVAANNLPDSLGIDAYLATSMPDAQADDYGIYYHFDKRGSGQLPQPGDYVKLNYVGKMLDGTVFDQSPADQPFVFRVGYRIVIHGWDKGIQRLPVGSRATLLIPAAMAYGESGLGQIPPETPLLFEIELLDILDAAGYDAYMKSVERREREAYERHVAEQFKKDKRLINDYAAAEKFRAKRTAKGVSYVIEKKGKGDLLKPGDKITVHYEGLLLDGTKFDSSFDRKEPFEFVLGTGKVIEGWDDALTNFRKGSKGWLMIPSKLAYGRRTIREKDIHIPADAVLVFKVEVVDVN